MKSVAPPLQQVDRTCVLYRNRKLTYFGGCDYFRLSSHPAVVTAIHSGLKKYGLGVAASRKTTGNHSLHEKLEARLARSEEHTSELQSPCNLVCRLLLEKKNYGELSYG